MYNLGIHLNRRYQKLLPANGLYSMETIQVLSSAAERCLMSAASFLAGFMQPHETNNKLPIKWQPIPINSKPRELDIVSILLFFNS